MKTEKEKPKTQTSMWMHPPTRKLNRSKSMSDIEKRSNAADGGLRLTPCSRSSGTPRTDAALDKDWTILDESLENVAKVSKELEIENGELFMAGYSARCILEDLNNEPGMWQMAKLTGLPMGVIVEAFLNIFAAHSAENVRDGRQLPATSRPELELTHNPQKTNP